MGALNIRTSALSADSDRHEPAAFDAAFFSKMYQSFEDPWGLSAHYYEKRKRALLMACLPRARFARAFEPGCATGELTALLAQRCDEVIASDLVIDAVEACRARLANAPNVNVTQLNIPQQWPEGKFDLIVISELAYYLDQAGLDLLADRVKDSLSSTGVILLCHWKPQIENAIFDGAGVHQKLAASVQLTSVVRHEEADFLLDVWSRDARSIARQEGIV